MSGLLGEEQIRKVREGTDLVALMSEYSPLTRAGPNYKCCCPFHQERTPSCMVYTDEPHYHCYGCGAHGDAIRLIMEKEGLVFTDAMEFLARRAGIVLQYQAGKGGGSRPTLGQGERTNLTGAMEWATGFFEDALWRSSAAAEARAYLDSRRLGQEVCRRFRLGWAPGRGRLVEAARKAGYAPEMLAQLDLARRQDDSGSWSDRFYERLMFPIADRFGQVVGFSGRLLPAAEKAAKEAGRGVGKYINSTETPLYRKGDVVFNLHRARTAARTAGRIAVMEGPTDVMAAEQAGFGECVAVLGTALTPVHAKVLANTIGDRGEVLMLFDGDSAGQEQSLKAVRTCLSVGLPCRVALMTEGLDPADLLAGADEAAKDEFRRVLATNRPGLDHLLRCLAPRPHALEPQRLLAVADECLACLKPQTDRDLRDALLVQVATYLGLEASRLHARMEGLKSPRQPTETAPVASPAAAAPLPVLEPNQRLVLQVLLHHQDLRATAFDELGLEPSDLPAPWSVVIDAFLAGPDLGLGGLLGREEIRNVPGLADQLGRWGQEAGNDPAVAATELADAVRNLRIAHLERDLHELEHRLRDPAQAADQGLGERYFNLRAEINRLRQPQED